MNLEIATLYYGSTQYPVLPSEISPLPLEFDFNNPVDCARKIFAIMSNASGGHTVRDCKLRINREEQIANLTGSGVHVYYAVKGRAKMNIEQILKVEKEKEVFPLGSVTTDQYGDGWKRATWVEQPEQDGAA